MPDEHLDRLRRATASPLPHPDLAALQAFAAQTVDWVLSDFASLPEQPVGRIATRAEMEALLREPPPEQGCDFGRVLAEFRDRVTTHSFRPNHPRFLAFVPGAPTPLAMLGDWLC